MDTDSLLDQLAPPNRKSIILNDVLFICCPFLNDEINHTRHLTTHANMVSHRRQRHVYLQKTSRRQTGSDFILLTDWRDALDLSDRWRTRTVTPATSEASHTSEHWRWCMSIITEVCGSTTSTCKNTLKGLFQGNRVSFIPRTLVYI